MRPFCMWDLQRRYMLGDQVLMFPRAAMNEVFEACQEDFMIGDLKFEGGNAMIPAQITRKNKPGVSGNKGTRYAKHARPLYFGIDMSFLS